MAPLRVYQAGGVSSAVLALRVGSPAFPATGSALPGCLGEVQARGEEWGHLSRGFGGTFPPVLSSKGHWPAQHDSLTSTQVITMILCGNTIHGRQYRPQLQQDPGPRRGSADIIPDLLVCFRTLNQDLTFGNSSGLDNVGGKQAIHIGLFLSTLTSSHVPLSPGHEPFHLSLPPPHPVVAHHNGA